ncbi:hypothetical protein OG898_18805 [Streptomyces sp. NBC_00193]|uniref:hypothetical protein n=1 Tax=Streptomyces sp. NBC_00193 TaxID=2975675 RepID=UPI002256B64A|nr:hypothetical protein [Streptomyces sp. NBC_00193]MCX5298509.1 hypothetical protein [Streptomyces sp. NBC_00193]
MSKGISVRAVEGAQPVGGPEVGVLARAAQDHGEVAADGRVGEQRAVPAQDQIVRDRALGHAAEGGPHPGEEGRAEGPQEQVERSGDLARGVQGLALEARRAVVEGLAGGEDEACDPLVVHAHEELGDAGVVLDEGDVVQVEAVEELGEESRDPVGGEVGARVHGEAVAADGEDRDEDAEVGAQFVDDGRVRDGGAGGRFGGTGGFGRGRVSRCGRKRHNPR